MKIISNIIKYIVIILLIISIILTLAVKVLTSTILNKDYILGKLEETNYYNNIYNQVESNFENYIYQSGLDEDVIKGIISEEDIKSDTIQIINNIYNNKEVTEVDISKIEERLEKNIYNSLSGQKISDSTKKSITQFINKITEEYKDTIVHTKYETSINKVLTKTISYSTKIQTVAIIVDVIIVILLLLLNMKNILRGIAQIGIALSSTGIFYIVVNFIVNSKVKIDYITVLNNEFSITLRNILHSIMNNILTNGIVILIIGIILIIIANCMLFKNTKNEELH